MSDRLVEVNQKLARHMLLTVDSIRLIRVFGQERWEAKRFEHASDEVRRSLFGVSSLAAMVGPGLEIAHAALFLGIVIGAYEAGISLPVLATFLVLLYRMQPFLRALEPACLLGPVLREARAGLVLAQAVASCARVQRRRLRLG
jgi:ABC-type multidrug transport system fused ATPase/permease subunit